MAHDQRLRCVGVMETDERHGIPDFGLEESRALTGKGGGAVNPNAQHNVHLLKDLCFLPLRRQEHEVQSMLDEVLKHAAQALPLTPCPMVPAEGVPPKPGAEIEPPETDDV